MAVVEKLESVTREKVGERTWVVLIISVLQRNFRGSLVDFREHGKAALRSQAARKPGLVA